MTQSQKLLLETLSGHFALLQSVNPRKANSATAKRARRYVRMKLRDAQTRAPMRLAA